MKDNILMGTTRRTDRVPQLTCIDLKSSSADIGLVSIIIPAYNVDKTLTKCVESALAQTYQNIEIIIIDDGATDGTANLADELASSYCRVRVIHQENRGLSGARNTGIDSAQGDLLFFLDADDYIEPNEIELLYSEMKSTGANLVVGGLVYETPDGVRGKTLVPKRGVVDEEGYWRRAYIDSTGDCVSYVVSCGKLSKRTAFQGMRFDEGKLHEDEFIIHRLIAQCSRIAFSGTAGYVYVQNQTSITHTPSVKSLLDGAEAFAMRTEYFLERGWWGYAWRTLIDGRCRLADAACCEMDASERDRLEQLISMWRNAYSALKAEDGGNVRRRLACRLFLISPKLFSRLNRIWMRK